MGTTFLSELLTTITDRGRAVLGSAGHDDKVMSAADLAKLCRSLVSRRGEATGVAIARDILAGWETMTGVERQAFLLHLARDFGPDASRLDRAVTAWRDDASATTLAELQAAVEPKRQELIRRLNLAPGGTQKLVRLREEMFRHQKDHPELAALDADFDHLFSSWFNRGFLVLRRIDWSTPASVLEKIIRYEAVHTIHGWDDLRRRIAPEDRRLFAFFHPQMGDEPLIFVEVALTDVIPDSIEPLLGEERSPIRADTAQTAVFYSISNCQDGLRGVSFGNFLIKQVVEDLKRELPRLKTFVTLSPLPGFAGWLARERAGAPGVLGQATRDALAPLDDPAWSSNAAIADRIKEPLLSAAAAYLLKVRTAKGKPIDPVARFHLGNGARLDRLNFLGDRSRKGLAQAHGLMVNYLYHLDSIEQNHEAFAERGEVVAAPSVKARITGHGSRPPAN